MDELRILPEILIYADDADFLSSFQDFLGEVVEVVVQLFKKEYKLIVNVGKTKQIKVGHLYVGVDQSSWTVELVN